MGRKIVLTGTKLTDLSAPRLLRYDRIESSGSLLLIDPTHPAGAWAPSAPADATSVPNVLGSLAETVTGFSASQLNGTMHRPAAFTGAAGLLERTGKGGLHGLHPQSGAAVLASGPAISFPTKLIEYILRNSQNDYYFSAWVRPTRYAKGSYASQAIIAINGSGQQTNSYLALTGMVPTDTASTATWLYRGAGASTQKVIPIAPHTLNDPKIITLGVTGWNSSTIATSLPGDGTNTTVTGTRAGGYIGFGSQVPTPGVSSADFSVSNHVFNHSGSSTTKDNPGSYVFYRTYLEDLTVSGRTYDQVNAIDQALYTKEVLTAGGRYHGDTYTDPATLA